MAENFCCGLYAPGAGVLGPSLRKRAEVEAKDAEPQRLLRPCTIESRRG